MKFEVSPVDIDPLLYLDEKPPSQKSSTARKYSSTLRPYYVWRETFCEDRCINQQQLKKENFRIRQGQAWPGLNWTFDSLQSFQLIGHRLQVAISSTPHLLLNLLLIVYLVLGAVFFQKIDENIAKVEFKDAVLFSFTTLTTIGYGNIYPVSFYGKLGCLIYCLLGIPFILLVLAMHGSNLTFAYNIINKSVTKSKDIDCDNDELPLPISLSILLLHSLIGGLIFSYWIDSMEIISAVYFSFISIATIGFGDLTPTPESWFQIFVIIVYMSIGIIILSTVIGSLCSYLKWIHYLGRPFSGTKDVEVWFGGDMLTVEQLVTIVAKQFSIDSYHLHRVLHDLDDILDAACDQSVIENPQTLEKRMEAIRNESCVIRIDNSDKVMVMRPSVDKDGSFIGSRNGTPLQMISPDSWTGKTLERDTENALRALGLIHYKLRKQGSFKRPRSNSVTLTRQSSATPTCPPRNQTTYQGWSPRSLRSTPVRFTTSSDRTSSESTN